MADATAASAASAAKAAAATTAGAALQPATATASCGDVGVSSNAHHSEGAATGMRHPLPQQAAGGEEEAEAAAALERQRQVSRR